MLSNPERRTINWKIDVNALAVDRIFMIHPFEGKIDSGQTLRIKAQFNPIAPGNYEKIVPVYIDDPDTPKNQAYMELILKGDSANPKLLFDRKEIMLPVVPTEIEASSFFRIINEGYENLTISYRIPD